MEAFANVVFMSMGIYIGEDRLSPYFQFIRRNGWRREQEAVKEHENVVSLVRDDVDKKKEEDIR